MLWLNNLQVEFKTLEEKAIEVLEDYEKAQVSCNFLFIICPHKTGSNEMCVYISLGLVSFPFQTEDMKR